MITALVHLGYLAYSAGKVRIPNREIAEEFAKSAKRNLHAKFVAEILFVKYNVHYK